MITYEEILLIFACAVIGGLVGVGIRKLFDRKEN